jgi:uncharacterized protein YerC
MINAELPVVEVSDSNTDFIFLLDDDTYLHYEFQTDYSTDDLIRFSIYDMRLYRRDKRKIQTVIIYSSDVSKAAENLDTGSVVFSPTNIMLYEYDGDTIYAELETKLKSGQELTDTDMLNLMFLPLMRNSVPKKELAKKSVELAQTIPDKNKRDACIASAVAFMSKYLNENEISSILEVLKMTDIMTRIITDEMIAVAKKLLKKGLSVSDISESTGLSIDTIEELQESEETEN